MGCQTVSGMYWAASCMGIGCGGLLGAACVSEPWGRTDGASRGVMQHGMTTHAASWALASSTAAREASWQPWTQSTRLLAGIAKALLGGEGSDGEGSDGEGSGSSADESSLLNGR